MKKHGMHGTPIYRRWVSMKHRTTPGSSAQNHNPGYVGVGRDPKWDTFDGFYEDMGDSYFDGAVLARHGDTGDYTRTNVRWVTKTENSREVREAEGRMPLTTDGRFAIDVAKEHGISRRRLFARIHRGWSVDRSATEPLHRAAVAYRDRIIEGLTCTADHQRGEPCNGMALREGDR